MLEKLFKRIKEVYPNKEIWLWTGRLFDDIKELSLFKYVNYVIDGGYNEMLNEKGLLWRGSKNQRNIDVQESLKQDKIVLSKYN